MADQKLPEGDAPAPVEKVALRFETHAPPYVPGDVAVFDAAYAAKFVEKRNAVPKDDAAKAIVLKYMNRDIAERLGMIVKAEEPAVDGKKKRGG